MNQLMRCLYCGLLQDEPAGVKACQRCGGELVYENLSPGGQAGAYLSAQMELDQVKAPAGRNIDRYLLVTLRAPAQVPAEQAAATVSGRPPLNFTAVLDVSGSMYGEKLMQAKEAVRLALHYLHEGDMLALVTFSDTVRPVLEPTVMSPQARKVVESALQEIEASGMTALDGGLELGIKKALANPLQNNLVLLLSDGQANVGETDLEKVGQRSKKARQSNLTISTIGVGTDYNEALMAQIAIQGGGRYYHVQAAPQIAAYLTGELGEAANLAARRVLLSLNLPAGGALMPLSAAYPAEMANGQVTVQVGDIPCDMELEIPLRLTLFAQQAGARLSVDGQVTYQSPAGNSLSTPLNRVTVRFLSDKEFSLREGMVVPIAERVVKHLRATQVMETSRAMAHSQQAGARQARLGLEMLRAYTELVGTAEARTELGELEEDVHALSSSPAQAKQHLSAAFKFHRSSKDFDKK